MSIQRSPRLGENPDFSDSEIELLERLMLSGSGNEPQAKSMVRKGMVSGYTKKDGTVVKPYHTSRTKKADESPKQRPAKNSADQPSSKKQARPKYSSETLASSLESLMSRSGLDPNSKYTRASGYKELPSADVINSIASEQRANKGTQSKEALKSYESLKNEIGDQYEALMEAGLRVEAWKGEGEPYRVSDDKPWVPSSKRMREEVASTGLFKFFMTEKGFGAGGEQDQRHPFLQESPYLTSDGEPMLWNDVFRVVHDAVAHLYGGFYFSNRGEMNGMLSHASTLSRDSYAALFAETFAQNSVYETTGNFADQNVYVSEHVGLIDKLMASSIAKSMSHDDIDSDEPLGAGRIRRRRGVSGSPESEPQPKSMIRKGMVSGYTKKDGTVVQAYDREGSKKADDVPEQGKSSSGKELLPEVTSTPYEKSGWHSDFRTMDGKVVDVFSNPSRRDILEITKEKRGGIKKEKRDVRGFADGDDLYVFDSYHANHNDARTGSDRNSPLKNKSNIGVQFDINESGEITYISLSDEAYESVGWDRGKIRELRRTVMDTPFVRELLSADDGDWASEYGVDNEAKSMVRKGMVSGYTKKDGTVVKPYQTSRTKKVVSPKQRPASSGPVVTKADIAIPQDARVVAAALASPLHASAEHGRGQVYAVGGSVRDHLFGKEPKDFDLATNLPEKEIVRRLEEAGLRVQEKASDTFGVVFVSVDGSDEPIEVAPFRSDAGVADGRRPESVRFGVPLEADAKRRDFTMNSLYYDFGFGEFGEGSVIDFSTGVEDINKGVVRPVGLAAERFREDRFRILRLMRFFSRYNGGDITEYLKDEEGNPDETWQAIQKYGDLVSEVEGLSPISGERIQGEFLNGLKQAISTEQYLKNYARLGLLSSVFPDMNVDERAIDNIGDSKSANAIMAWLLKGNEGVGKSLNKLKYPNKNSMSVQLLIDAINLGPDDIYSFMRRKASNPEISKAVSADLRALAMIASDDKELSDKLMHLSEYKAPSVSGAELAKRGFKGKEIGAEQRRVIIDHFKDSFTKKSFAKLGSGDSIKSLISLHREFRLIENRPDTARFIHEIEGAMYEFNAKEAEKYLNSISR